MSSQTARRGDGVASRGAPRVSRTELDPTSFLHRSATIHPDRVAVVYGELRRTYAELRRAREPAGLGAARARAGAPRSRRRAAARTCPSCWSSTTRVPAAGGVLVAINMRLSADEIGYILEHSGRACWSSTPSSSRCGGGARRRRDHPRPATRTRRSSPRAIRPACRVAAARRGGADRDQLHLAARPGRPKGVIYTLPRRVPQRARRGDRGRARPPPGLPVDAADVPLQRLVLPLGGHRGGGHARLPARRSTRR